MARLRQSLSQLLSQMASEIEASAGPSSGPAAPGAEAPLWTPLGVACSKCSGQTFNGGHTCQACGAALIKGIVMPDGRRLSPQQAAVESEADELFFGGGAGGGKLMSLDEVVATPWGWKRHGDLIVGDQVCNPDGSIARVIALYDRINQPIYRITFDDGASCEAGGEHLWCMRRISKERFQKRDSDDIPSRFQIATTQQILALCNRGHRIGIPLTKPVNYTVTSRNADARWPVKPYALGALLGDGHLSEAAATLTCADDEIVELIKADGYAHGRIGSNAGNRARSFPFRGAIVEGLASLGLVGARAWEKFIPERYLTTATDARAALLRGLMDTDGYADSRGHASYTTVSKRLAEDVQVLARSLGYKARITSRVPTYSYLGERLHGRLAFTVAISGAEHQGDLFSLRRKQIRAKQPYNGGAGRSERTRVITNIEYLRHDTGRCIAVNHPNGLYLTRDFIVTHNTDLIIGLAVTEQHNTIIFRREFTQFRGEEGLWARSKQIIGMRGVPNESTLTWRHLPGGRALEMGAVQHERHKRKYMGRAHDGKFFDELPQMPERLYRFLNGWKRTTIPGQRVRTVGTGNPPMAEEEKWVIAYWAPWLDPKHPNPAKPGELRWYVVVDGKDVEVEDSTPLVRAGKPGCPHVIGKESARCPDCNGEVLRPRSRTFIPSNVEDNPHYMRTGYADTLNALPEPLRSQLRHSSFTAGVKDDDWQVIPTAWILAAQERWTEEGWKDAEGKAIPVSQVGVDPSRGGSAEFVITPVRGSWVGKQVVHTAKEASDGPKGALLVARAVGGKKGIRIQIDIGGAAGPAVYDYCLSDHQLRAIALDGSRASKAMDRTKKFGFVNKRAEWHWRMREALDPEKGLNLALPPDAQLRADLCAPRWSLHSGRILVEKKEEIMTRLGRSPDRGESCMYGVISDGVDMSSAPVPQSVGVVARSAWEGPE